MYSEHIKSLIFTHNRLNYGLNLNMNSNGIMKDEGYIEPIGRAY